MAEHFFAAAPCLSWFQWAIRCIWRQPHPPTAIQTQFEKNPLPPSPTGVRWQPMKSQKANEYSNFLSQYFYPTQSEIQLCVPVKVFERGLDKSSDCWSGTQRC